MLTNLFDPYSYVLINNQHGGFAQTVIEVNSPGQAVFAGLNGDGYLDAVIGDAGIGSAYVYIRRLGRARAGRRFRTNVYGQSAAAGLPDIVAPDGTGGIMVLLNTTK